MDACNHGCLTNVTRKDLALTLPQLKLTILTAEVVDSLDGQSTRPGPLSHDTNPSTKFVGVLCPKQ